MFDIRQYVSPMFCVIWCRIRQNFKQITSVNTTWNWPFEILNYFLNNLSTVTEISPLTYVIYIVDNQVCSRTNELLKIFSLHMDLMWVVNERLLCDQIILKISTLTDLLKLAIFRETCIFLTMICVLNLSVFKSNFLNKLNTTLFPMQCGTR